MVGRKRVRSSGNSQLVDMIENSRLANSKSNKASSSSIDQEISE